MLETDTTFLSKPPVHPTQLGPDHRAKCESQYKTAPGGWQAGLPRDGLKHSNKKYTLACSAFAIPGEPGVVCCHQGAAARPAVWVEHH